MKNLQNYVAASWQTLGNFYGSHVGKAILVLSITVPISKLLKLGLELPIYELSLTGALVLLLGFLAYSLAVPERIKGFVTKEAFATHQVNLEQQDILDIPIELESLDNLTIEKKSAAVKVAGLPSNFINFFPVRSACEVLGKKKAVYYFSLIAYVDQNLSRFTVRMFSTWLFVIGALLLYNGAIKATFDILART